MTDDQSSLTKQQWEWVKLRKIWETLWRKNQQAWRTKKNVGYSGDGVCFHGDLGEWRIY